MPKFIPEFASFLSDLSDIYSGTDALWLRLLLNDHCAGETLGKKQVSGIILFNELAEKGYISFSPPDVKILLDIAKVTEKADAENLIATFQAKHPNKIKDFKFTRGKPLPDYRKRLFKTVRQIKDRNVEDVATVYGKRQYPLTNFWDLVFHLEKDLLLQNTENSIKIFAKQLNEEASEVLLGAPNNEPEGGGQLNALIPDPPQEPPGGDDDENAEIERRLDELKGVKGVKIPVLKD